MIIDKSIAKAKSAAKALLRAGDAIPSDAKRKLLDTVHAYLQSDDVTQAELETLTRVDHRKLNDQYLPQGKVVVDAVTGVGLAAGGPCSAEAEDRLDMFVRQWRQHFLEKLQPRFLPEGWSVDYRTTSRAR